MVYDHECILSMLLLTSFITLSYSRLLLVARLSCSALNSRMFSLTNQRGASEMSKTLEQGDQCDGR